MRYLPFGRKALAVLVGSLSLASMSAQAEFKPAGVKVPGGLVLVPVLNVTEKYDDNIYSTTTNAVDSFVTIVRPELSLVAEDKANAYRLLYALEGGFYSESSGDNYTDQTLRADAQIEAGSRWHFLAGGELDRLHDPRGTGSTEGNPGAVSEPDQYDLKRVDGTVAYGATQAAGRLEFDGAWTNREYVNHRDISAYRDRTNTDVGATFYYKVAPKTSLLFNLHRTGIDYTESFVNLDSTETSAYVGATWDITGKTSGKVKVGSLKKDFQDASLKDGSGASWELGAAWQPTRFDVVSLTTTRRAEETDGVGSWVDVQSHLVSWQHEWVERLSSAIYASPSKRSYKDGNRTDDIQNLGLNVNYEYDRWMKLSAGYNWTQRDSNVDSYDYDRNTFTIGVNASL